MQLVFLFFFLLASPPLIASTWFSDLHAPEQIPYRTTSQNQGRMSMVQEVGERFGLAFMCPEQEVTPALKQKHPQISLVGWLGGIYLNTARQKETDRDQFPIWSVANSSLTVEVYAYMQDFLAERSCSESPFISHFGPEPVQWQQTQIDRYDVCQAWANYFSLAQSSIAALQEARSGSEIVTEANKKWLAHQLKTVLWTAHSHSLFHVWVSHKAEFEAALADKQIPEKEYAMWNAWNKVVVEVLPALNVPPCASQMWPHLHSAMPLCHYDKVKASGQLICEKRILSSDEEERKFSRFVNQVIESQESLRLSEAIQLVKEEVAGQSRSTHGHSRPRD